MWTEIGFLIVVFLLIVLAIMDWRRLQRRERAWEIVNKTHKAYARGSWLAPAYLRDAREACYEAELYGVYEDLEKWIEREAGQ